MKIVKTAAKYKVDQSVWMIKEVVLEDDVTAEYHITECIIKKIEQRFCSGGYVYNYNSNGPRKREPSKFEYRYTVIPIGATVPIKDIDEDDLILEHQVNEYAKAMYQKRVGELKQKIEHQESVVAEANEKIAQTKTDLKKFEKLLLKA